MQKVTFNSIDPADFNGLDSIKFKHNLEFAMADAGNIMKEDIADVVQGIVDDSETMKEAIELCSLLSDHMALPTSTQTSVTFPSGLTYRPGDILTETNRHGNVAHWILLRVKVTDFKSEGEWPGLYFFKGFWYEQGTPNLWNHKSFGKVVEANDVVDTRRELAAGKKLEERFDNKISYLCNINMLPMDKVINLFQSKETMIA